MKLKNTLTLLVIAAGLFGFIWFWDKDWASTPQAADNVGRVVRFDRDEIKGIYKTMGIAPASDVEEEFIVGRANYNKGVRVADLPATPFYAS